MGHRQLWFIQTLFELLPACPEAAPSWSWIVLKIWPLRGSLGLSLGSWAGKSPVGVLRIGRRHMVALAFLYLCSWSPREKSPAITQPDRAKRNEFKAPEEDLDNNIVSGLGSNCCNNITSHLYRTVLCKNAFTYIIVFDLHNFLVK